MRENHRTEYSQHVQDMPEHTTQHKQRKGLVLLKYSTILFQEAYDKIHFGVGKTRPSSEQMK